MVVEAQATPTLARSIIEHIWSITDKPISHLVLTCESVEIDLLCVGNLL
jgi:hypothetical protein